MISAVSWVPRGAARAVPLVTEVKPQELEALKQRLERQVVLGDDADSDAAGSVSEESAEMDDSDLEAGDAVARARAAAATLKGSRSGKSRSHAGASDAAGSIEAAMQELDMDNYDEPDPEAHGNLVMRAMGGKLAIAPGDDPYLTLGDSEDDSDEVEDLTLKPTDLLILAARNEDDVSNLEVWVYEEAEALGDEANVYVHHELVLPAFPLCLAWLDLSPAGADPSLHGNFVAIGSMEPGIEIWDLDVIDGVEPVAVLGGEDKAGTAAAAAAARQEAIEAAEAGGDGKLDKKKKKKLKTKLKKKSTGPVYKPGSHQGPVLGLSWNPEYRNVLASGSADHTVKVWDVSCCSVAHSLTHHSDKVQAVAWNPAEPQVLLTGGFDKLAALVDVRQPSAQELRWSLSADVEALAWSPHQPTQFLVSSEDGLVACFDARMGQGAAPLFRLEAHSKPACALAFSPGARGLLATGSTDKHTKLWDISTGAPALIVSQDLQVGAIFTMGFCPDAPHLLAMGGAKGAVTVWDVRASEAVASKFPALLEASPKQVVGTG